MTTALSWQQSHFLLSTDKNLLQVHRIHGFLSTQAYWSLKVPLAVVQKAIQNSLCLGLFDQSGAAPVQIGFARIVTDGATFAWICDVYVEASHRGQGLSKWMMESLLTLPELKGLRRLCLATKDAHKLYEKYGFQVTLTPGNWLEIKDNDVYLKAELQKPR